MSALQTPPVQSAQPSPSPTVTDLPSLDAKTKELQPFNTESTKAESTLTKTPTNTAPIKLSQRKKWALLAVFSLGFFVDVWSYSVRDPPH
jgi:hypothetical protein